VVGCGRGKPRRRGLARVALGALVVFFLCAAAPVKADASTNANAPVGPTDPVEMEAFLDDFIGRQLATYQIPGAAVAVVVDGKLFFAKGYGVINSRSSAPVVADRTLFHIGSVTKLLTWTAVMQLVEQGKLDLHADVNTYLTDFQIPATYPEPITLHHLLTHTPGFEDQIGNLARFSHDDGLPLDQYVVKYLPARVMPPGQLIAYSNYGAALAGYIILQVTGMSYEQYIEEHIFKPLEMHRSSIRQPIPEAWTADLALGHYQGVNGPVPLHEYFPCAPTVGLSATVTDIAHFMIMHLQNGRYGDVQVLQEATAQAMHQQQFTHDPRLPGVTYGFVEWEHNGQHVLWHGGSTGFFESMILLLPEHNVGAFIAYNYKIPTMPGREFRQAFLDHYYPAASTTTPHPLPDAAARVQAFVGDYRESRWAFTHADKFAYMFIRYYKMRATPDGRLILNDVAYVETAPLVFQAVDGQGTLIFHTDEKGHPIYGFYDFDAHKVFIKLPWYQTRPVHLAILIVCGLLFLSTLPRYPAGKLPDHAPWLLAEAETLFRWFGTINLVYPVGMFIICVTVLLKALPDLAFLAPMFVLMLLAPLSLAFSIVALAWKEGYWSVARRVHYTLVALAQLTFAGWLNAWNLLRLWQL